jgi:hypothetical protein
MKCFAQAESRLTQRTSSHCCQLPEVLRAAQVIDDRSEAVRRLCSPQADLGGQAVPQRSAAFRYTRSGATARLATFDAIHAGRCEPSACRTTNAASPPRKLWRRTSVTRSPNRG